MALLAMLALSACSSDDSAAEADSQSVVVVFQLSIPRTEAASTRATTETVAAGSELEHRLSSLHVALYNKQGEFIAQEQGLRITKQQTISTGNYEYTANVEVSMVVPEDKRTTAEFEGELVVYANTGIPASASYVGTGISDLTFQLSSNTAPDALPMWGMRAIKADDNVVLTAGTRNDLTGSDAIDLMRSVAKVTVDLTSEMVNDGWKFEDLWLTHYNDKGYVLPKGYFSQNAVNSYEFASATTLMAYPGDNKDNNARFRAYSTTENGVTTVNSGALTELHFNNGTAATAGLPVYIPEYDNTTPGVTPSTIRLKLKRNGTSEGTTYELKFANYNSKPSDDGSGDYDQVVSKSEFNIVRNTWYQYHVYKLSKHKIGVTLTVKPWYYVEHDPIVM